MPRNRACRRSVSSQASEISAVLLLDRFPCASNVAVHARPTSRPIESECDERGTIVERLVVGRSMEPLVGPEIHFGCSVRLSEWGTLPHAAKSDLIYGHWQNPCRRSFAVACQDPLSHAKESRLPSIRFVASKRNIGCSFIGSISLCVQRCGSCSAHKQAHRKRV